MKGTITKIDLVHNTGVILDINKKKYIFCLDECVGFDSYPEVEETVEFGLDNNEIYYVEPYSEKNNQESISVAILPEQEVVEHISSNKKNIPLQANISLTKSIDECLDHYFDEIVAAVYKYEAQFAEGETLDFVLMRRFLNTAYNNLKDIDSSFMNEYLLELRSDLIVLEKIYNKFSKKSTVPECAYESIFLDQQVIYQQNKTRMDFNISELFSSTATVKSLENHITEIERQIKKGKLHKDLLEVKIRELKRYKTYYVDSIHKMGTLKEENKQIKESIQVFENKHKDEFIKTYKVIVKQYNEFIVGQLNGYAYEFDKKMWQGAEKSTSIRTYFKKGNIEDDFSSKTFLKYFINTLDKTKYSSEHKRLYKMLEYLESRAKLRFLIVSENSTEADRIKHILRSFDKDYSVEKSDRPRSVFYKENLKSFDIIFIDASIQNPMIFEFLNTIKTRLHQVKSNAVLCVVSNIFKKDMLIKLKNEGLEHLLDSKLNDLDFGLMVKKIIDTYKIG